MKISLFSPILILLMMTLFTKASVLFGRIREQTTYSPDTTTSSMIIDTAYAKAIPTHTKSSEFALNNAPSENNEEISENKIEQPEEKIAELSVISSKNIPENNVTTNLTKSEIELLKELSKRREKLEDDKKDIDIRQQVLKATENKIDQKIVELKHLQVQLEELMKQYDHKENTKLLSLVKIYETMKPKEAAKIFNELEMPILLRVVSNMKEVKVAPIIANMDSTKARDLSMELANQKPLN